MKYKTITFDANRPVAKQITEPLDSDYGIAVKVYKDGEPISADLSVDGAACTYGPDGWHLAELSSGNVETMKIVDVDVAKDPTINKEINPIGEAVNTSSRTKTVYIIVPLSAFFDSDITIKPEDVKVMSYKVRFADDTAEYSDDWADAENLVITPGKGMTF